MSYYNTLLSDVESVFKNVTTLQSLISTAKEVSANTTLIADVEALFKEVLAKKDTILGTISTVINDVEKFTTNLGNVANTVSVDATKAEGFIARVEEEFKKLF